MIRLHLTADDLLRTRIVPTYGPIAETLFALTWPVRGRSHPVLDHWRRTLGSPPGQGTSVLRALTHGGAGGHPPVDLFTIMGPAKEPGDALARLSGATTDRVIGELEDAAGIWHREGRAIPTRLGYLVRTSHGSRQPGRLLAGALRDGFGETLRPYWHHAESYLAEQHRRRATVIAEHGLGALLATIHDSIRWIAPVLTFPSYGQRTLDVYPQGRGLLLAPSLFLSPYPMLFRPPRDSAEPFTVFFPAVPDALTAAAIWHRHDGEPDRRNLGALLGRTRAAVLNTLQTDCSTTQLAARIHTSSATASEHTSVLRAAGLVRSRRDGGSVVHSLTNLGQSLLNGDLPATYRSDIASVKSA